MWVNFHRPWGLATRLLVQPGHEMPVYIPKKQQKYIKYQVKIYKHNKQPQHKNKESQTKQPAKNIKEKEQDKKPKITIGTYCDRSPIDTRRILSNSQTYGPTTSARN